MYGAAASFNPNTVPVQPIVSLTPFLGGKPWIKARVTDKGQVRTWDKPTSKGKLFSCTLVDETTSIRITFFGDAVDSLYDIIVPGSVYYLSGFSTRNANRKFNPGPNDYELSADRDVQVHLATDQAASALPMQRFNFVPLNAVAHKEKNSVLDVLAIVTEIVDVATISSAKTGPGGLLKRSVKIADSSAAITMTMWGESAQDFPHRVGSLLAFKNLRVSDFDTVSLSYSRDSSIVSSAQLGALPDCQRLKQWYESTGGTSVQQLSVTKRNENDSNIRHFGRRFLSAVATEKLGRTPEKTDQFDCVLYPTFIKTDQLWYDACVKCQKKVVSKPDGGVICEKCGGGLANSEPRYLFSIQCSDNVSGSWFTLFQEAGEQFWGMKAPDLKLRSLQDPGFITSRAAERLHCPMLATVRAKEDRMPASTDATGQPLPETDRIRLTISRIAEISQSCCPPDITAMLTRNEVGPFAATLRQESHFLQELISAYHAKGYA